LFRYWSLAARDHRVVVEHSFTHMLVGSLWSARCRCPFVPFLDNADGSRIGFGVLSDGSCFRFYVIVLRCFLPAPGRPPGPPSPVVSCAGRLRGGVNGFSFLLVGIHVQLCVLMSPVSRWNHPWRYHPSERSGVEWTRVVLPTHGPPSDHQHLEARAMPQPSLAIRKQGLRSAASTRDSLLAAIAATGGLPVAEA